MLGDNKNLKDPITGGSLTLRDSSFCLVSYPKTNKLITALFMVTDIMDKEEPMRGKLRSLGISILSDMYSNPVDSDKKVSEILVLLDIAKDIRMISEMNISILKKEFEELLKSIRIYSPEKGPVWLEEFLKDEIVDVQDRVGASSHVHKQVGNIRQVQPTRIGVQKGGTLLKALKGVAVSNTHNINQTYKKTNSDPSLVNPNNQNYEILRTKRREEIISIIKNKLSVMPESGGATITDIKNSAEGPLVSCGEKTLQRELIAMVHDGVLYKTGEKRWSRYSIKN